MTFEKPKSKQLLRPITPFLAITCNSLEAREISRVHGAIGFGFASHWLKNWRESFKPITKRSNRNHGITFDSHLKTTLPAVMSLMVFCFFQSYSDVCARLEPVIMVSPILSWLEHSYVKIF